MSNKVTGSAGTATRNGVLYVVATPIGNLGDITQRALEVLSQVDAIAVEDSRHSSRLLQQFQIDTPMIAFHEHNEREQAPKLVERLLKGDSLALISDAGTPLVSDPGYHLVRLAREEKIPVVPVPGASAMLAALSVSGLPSDRFIFEGFLPAKSHARKKRLAAVSREPRTLIFYEAPHRLLETLADMGAVLGEERYTVMARELTKTYETIRGDTITNLYHWVSSDPNQQKGEIVLLVQGKTAANEEENEAEGQRILAILLEELPLSQASALAARISGARKKTLYQYGLTLNEGKT
ncbi:16S rRNA (cytidine(1402)-2'-O)-methyltransferase [Kaarinaea lacus]